MTRGDSFRRMQEGMRAMSEAEIAERERRLAPSMQNVGMRPVPGMENIWATNVDHWLPEKPEPKPTLWQRLKRWSCKV